MPRKIEWFVFLLGLLSLAGWVVKAQQRTQEEQVVRQTIRRFWEAFGQRDAQGLQQVVHLPFLAVEVDEKGRTSTFFVVDEKMLRRECQEVEEPLRVEIADLKVQMVGPEVAVATYTVKLPEERNAYRLVTMLAKKEKVWKIIATTIPM